MNSNQNNPNQDADIQKTENTLKIQKKIGNYILLDTIGKGTFSKVTLGYHIQTNQTVAIKILEKDKIQDKIDIERINREITILKLLYHPNISQLYETLSTSHNFYIMMEYIDGGDLFEYISTNNFLSEQKSCKYFRQLISAIEYLNKLGIAHRDIKPENILLNSSKTTLKLIDFGLSNFCGKDEMLNSSCGSPCYASPEMISGYPYYGLISDIWSCGIVLYCMLIGSLPFDDENLKILYDQITEGKFYVPSTLSNEAIDLLKKLLCVNPQKRITLNEIKNHVWFNMDKSVLYKGIFLKEKKINVDFNVVHKIKEKFFKEDVNVTENTLAQIVRNNGCNKYSATYHLYLKMYNKKLQEDEKNLNKNNTGILEIKFKKKRDNNNIFSNNVNNNNYDKKLNVVVINNIISNSSSIKNIKKKIKIKNNKNNKIQTQTTNNNNNTRNNTTNNNNSTPHSNNKVNNYTKKKKETNLKLKILTNTLKQKKKKTKKKK
jgi:serine/threonine protein kinase